jgi:uncharacterized membrane protein YccC
MKAIDLSTIAAVGVLVAALTAFVSGFGVTIPLWIPSSIPLIAGAIIFALRAYVAFVGADNTSVDERLAKAEELIASARRARELFPADEAPTRKDGPR